MEIPAVLSIPEICSIVKNGDKVVLDGASGEAMVNPDNTVIKQFEEKLSAYQKEKELLAEYAGKPSVTKDGTKVELVCNIGKPEEAKKRQSVMVKALDCSEQNFCLWIGTAFLPRRSSLRLIKQLPNQ